MRLYAIEKNRAVTDVTASQNQKCIFTVIFKFTRGIKNSIQYADFRVVTAVTVVTVVEVIGGKNIITVVQTEVWAT
jgi:hypothetical protein